jgi:hypothetical protein
MSFINLDCFLSVFEYVKVELTNMFYNMIDSSFMFHIFEIVKPFKSYGKTKIS